MNNYLYVLLDPNRKQMIKKGKKENVRIKAMVGMHFVTLMHRELMHCFVLTAIATKRREKNKEVQTENKEE